MYTIAGATVVITAAGVVYYLSESSKTTKETTSPSTGKSRSKKTKRKAKKEVEEVPKKDTEEPKSGSCRDGF